MTVSIEQQIRELTVGIVDDIVAGRLEHLRFDTGTREDFAAALEDYRKYYPIVPLPPEGLAQIDILQPRGETDLWSVETWFWTRDGGPSELRLYLTFRRTEGKLIGEIYDIRVP
ncbi:DUF7668 domain-containing protein [Nannocystis punicea]|uniref:DUF7668 domain-containing protein n=1 Tax=Nannocystis punicea TaxID=2995304 RepID=A0ABY7HAV2_9BACT|nr:hypothetical protein [Nannocystis poenicansa]WAS96382.1 hypothetical protein O0S08_09500 [Nannocystis poenicansa]